MDFKTTTQVSTQINNTESPFLALDGCNQTDSDRQYLGNTDYLWHPYSKLTPADGASIQLPTAMLESTGINYNSNFDGVLDAET